MHCSSKLPSALRKEEMKNELDLELDLVTFVVRYGLHWSVTSLSGGTVDAVVSKTTDHKIMGVRLSRWAL